MRTLLLLLMVLTACDTAKPPQQDTAAPTDADGDGYLSTEDCNDADSTVNPGAIELCNGVDDDCDEQVDEDVTTTFYADADADGFGDPGTPIEACDPAPGTVTTATDCDDADPDAWPGNPEVCDGADNDCDGTIDDGVTTTFYVDADGDGHGDADQPVEACEAIAGVAAAGDDCDDADPRAAPGLTESCDGIDNDCDGEMDEGVTITFYEDADGDGFGVEDRSIEECEPSEGYAADAGDCDDDNAAVNPSTDERCNGVDDDCDGDTDEADAVDAVLWYLDADADGYGDAGSATVACEAPAGHVGDGTDCDDDEAAVNPGATEVCNGVDDDCDTDIDDEDSSLDATTTAEWYADTDGDGFGDASVTTDACDAPSGFVSDDTDCDDGDGAVFPGADPHCGIDGDCDGDIDDFGPGDVLAGDTASGASRHYQYSDTGSGLGWLDANWTGDTRADAYDVAVGTSAGASDVLAWTDVGLITSGTLTGLSLDGAWTGAEYFVSVRATTGGDACTTTASSESVQIAEGTVWTGDVADLRPDDAWGGGAADWPATGMDAVFGAHYFEDIEIASGDEVLVQGWGAVDAVSSGVSGSAPAVTSPGDGWVALYANDIVVDGAIVASGRGYGGGGGAAGGPGGPTGARGQGGAAGLGGAGGGVGSGYTGAGGGGSPGGAGGVAGTTGGAGNRYGGGSGSTGCSGRNGRAGGDGAVSTIGGNGGTARSGVVGAAGAGEYSAGGGRGVAGCDNWSGGGGGGYGGGGGGGSQWGNRDASGGGGGGSGGVGGGTSNSGGAGAGPFGGAGGASRSSTGRVGGYLAAQGNGDTSTDRSLVLGSGGGGGGSGYQESGGGGGGAGGGAILLYAFDTLEISATGSLRANGAGAGGGARDNGGSSTSFAGGAGAGGTIVIEGGELTLSSTCPLLSARGGGGATSNGGSIKLFYTQLFGSAPDASCAGRVLDAGEGSWTAP